MTTRDPVSADDRLMFLEVEFELFHRQSAESIESLRTQCDETKKLLEAIRRIVTRVHPQ